MNSIWKYLFVLLSVASIAYGQFGLFSGRSPQDQFERGVESYNDGRYVSAAATFRKLVKTGNGELLTAGTLMLMKSEFQSGKIAEALKIGRSFTQNYPQSDYLKDIYFCFGDIFIQNGQFGEAMRQFLMARKLTSKPRVLSEIDTRLIKLVEMGVNVDEIDKYLAVEGSVVNNAILHLAKASQQILNGQPDDAAITLTEFNQEYLPEQYTKLYQLVLRKTYRPVSSRISFGVILPLSGSEAAKGRIFFAGLTKIVNELNDNGIDLNLSVYNNNSDPVESVQAVRKFARNPNISMILGPLTSENSIAAAIAAQDIKIPIILPYSLKNNLSSIGNFVFQMNSTTDMRGRLAGRYLAKELDLDSLAVLAPSDDFGHSMVDAFITEVDAAGKTVVAVEWYTGIPENLRRQFLSLRKTGFSLQRNTEFDEFLGMEIDSLDAMFEVSDEMFFDIPENEEKPLTRSDSAKIVLETIQGIFMPIHPGHIQYLGTQFPAFNLKAQLVGNENWLEMSVLNQEIIGPHLDGMVFISNYLVPQDSASSNYFDSEGTDYSRFFFLGFDSALLLSQLSGGEVSTRAKAREELGALDQFTGLTQLVTFSEETHNINTALRVLEYHNQELIDRGFFHGDSMIRTNPEIPQ